MGRNRNFWESRKRNNQTFIMYYERLLSIAISRFKWNNLPPSVDSRFLELVLCCKGYACFFKDDVMGYLALESTIGGELTVYRIPTYRMAYATNGYQMNLTNEDSVLIFNNLIHTPSMLDIELYALKLYEIDRTIDINIKAQKTPILITCAENQLLTLKNLYQQYDGNEPVIFKDKYIDTKNLSVLKTDAPYVSDKLTELKTQTWNECLTALGISNVSYQKRERLISDEVSRSMGGTMANRFSVLESRKQACDQINRMFPELNISVEFNEDLNIVDDKESLGGRGEEE